MMREEGEIKVGSHGFIKIKDELTGRIEYIPIEGNTVLHGFGRFLLWEMSRFATTGSLGSTATNDFTEFTNVLGTSNVIDPSLLNLSCEAGSDTTTPSTRDMTGVVSPFSPAIETTDVTAAITGDSTSTQNKVTWVAEFAAGSFDGTQTVGEFVFKASFIASDVTNRAQGNFGTKTGLIRICKADGDFESFTPSATETVTVNYVLEL